MGRLTLLERYCNEQPPGSWRFIQKETGVQLVGECFAELVTNVKLHRRANNLPIGTDIDAEVEDWLCATMPEGGCEERHEGGLRMVGDSRLFKLGRGLTLREAMAGTALLTKWFVKGRPLVPREQAEGRGTTCIDCPKNLAIKDCASCAGSQLRVIVADLVGTENHVSMEEKLGACDVCGCGLAAKVWFPLDFMTGNVRLEDYPSNCWIHAEQRPQT